MKITLKTLEDRGACASQVALFKQYFGTSAHVTKANCMKVAKVFQWGWAAQHLLHAPAYKAYYDACVTANKAYSEACVTARKARDEACGTADKAYNEACVTAGKVHREACAAADKAYNEACVTARKVHREDCATAFWRSSRIK